MMCNYTELSLGKYILKETLAYTSHVAIQELVLNS